MVARSPPKPAQIELLVLCCPHNRIVHNAVKRWALGESVCEPKGTGRAPEPNGLVVWLMDMGLVSPCPH